MHPEYVEAGCAKVNQVRFGHSKEHHATFVDRLCTPLKPFASSDSGDAHNSATRTVSTASSLCATSGTEKLWNGTHEHERLNLSWRCWAVEHVIPYNT